MFLFISYLILFVIDCEMVLWM